MKWIAAYLVAGISFGFLDFLWLGWAGPNLYRPALGDLLAPEFRLAPALLFYLFYVAGMVWFAVRPGLALGSRHALFNGVLLGAIAYSTYDLTNQATLQAWPVHLTIVDIAWGAFATGLASGISARVVHRFTGG